MRHSFTYSHMSEVIDSYGRCKPGLRFFVQDCPAYLLNAHTIVSILRKLSYKLSLVNSHCTLMQLLCSFCKDMRVNKTYKLSLVNSHQLY